MENLDKLSKESLEDKKLQIDYEKLKIEHTRNNIEYAKLSIESKNSTLELFSKIVKYLVIGLTCIIVTYLIKETLLLSSASQTLILSLTLSNFSFEILSPKDVLLYISLFLNLLLGATSYILFKKNTKNILQFQSTERRFEKRLTKNK